jgi:PHD/YefM family antitoxin component YafN of YafNO toxin-antitoxin module
MRTEPLSALESDARKLVAELGTDKTALILGEDGSPAAYLVDPETYESALDRLHLLESITIGEQALAEGRVLSHDQVKEKLAKWLK